MNGVKDQGGAGKPDFPVSDSADDVVQVLYDAVKQAG